MAVKPSITRDEQYALEGFASPALYRKVIKNSPGWTEVGLFYELVYRLALELLPASAFNRAPRSAKDLLTQLATILSPDAASTLSQNLSSFDSMAGIQCSEAFLAERSINAWLKLILESVFSSATAAHLGQFDGADDRDMFWTPESSGSIGTIQQINLQGRTLLDGWTAHGTTRQLSGLLAGQVFSHDPMTLGSDWSPAQPGSNFVYHGTASHYRTGSRWPDLFEAVPFGALEARKTSNQLAPGAVVFTSFSPLRAFLWSAFTSHLPVNIPAGEHLLHMQRPWQARGQHYRGIVVFQFTSQQPAPQGLSSYIIPPGHETAWGQRSLQSGRDDAFPGHEWTYYRDIHGQTGTSWPDLVHGLEYGPQRARLAPFHTNMWRTAHKSGPAVDKLNAGHRGTYAISFRQSDRGGTQPPAPTRPGPSNYKDDKDDKGKGGRKHGEKFGSVGRAFLQVKKSMSSLRKGQH